MKIIKKKDQPITKWSGGATRQLYIYPQGSSLQNRDFFFRLSTATIEVETSTFTPMPGYWRSLMVLEGELELHHKDHHNSKLKSFDTDHFLGDWETSCQGKAVDFNAIHNNKFSCKIHRSMFDQEVEYSLDYAGMPSLFKLGMYVLSGQITFTGQDASLVLEENDFICVDSSDLKEGGYFNMHSGASVIIVTILELRQ